MAQLVLDLRKGFTILDQQRCEGVSKVVEANPTNAELSEALVEVSDLDVIHVYAATLLALTLRI
jgi:hypothetical protein